MNGIVCTGAKMSEGLLIKLPSYYEVIKRIGWKNCTSKKGVKNNNISYVCIYRST